MKHKNITIATILTLGAIGGVLYFAGDAEQTLGASKKSLSDDFNKSALKGKYALNNFELTKKEIKNANLDKHKGEPKDEISIKIGNNTIGDFEPDIELKRWNEASFKIKTHNLLVGKTNKKISFEGDKIKYKTKEMDFEMFDVAATTTDGLTEGGYKFVWYLNEPPATNVISFEIESAGLDFFYQPELTPEEIAQGAFRPENVVGSYAVYHSTKGVLNDSGDKDYKAGKAFHIYRPHIIDASGAETWGILHIENGVYSVEIPQEFLDTAVYPVKSNDTFGYTTAGSTQDGPNGNEKGSTFASPSSAGSISKLTFSGKANVSIDANAAIYSGGAGSLGSRVALNSSTGSVGTSQAWIDVSLSYTFTASTNYWLFGDGASGASLAIYYDTGVSNQGYSTNNAGLLTTLNTSAYTNYKFSIYATYTPTAGGTVSPSPVIFFE